MIPNWSKSYLIESFAFFGGSEIFFRKKNTQQKSQQNLESLPLWVDLTEASEKKDTDFEKTGGSQKQHVFSRCKTVLEKQDDTVLLMEENRITTWDV